MDYLAYAFLSWVFWLLVSVYFRFIELKNKKTYFWRQFFVQVIIFVFFTYLFWKYFSFYEINLWFLNLNWFWIFFIVSSISFYMFQTIYEYSTWNSLYPTKDELEEILKNKRKDS